jgi:non-specific serine/threonine protein kinase
LRFAQTANPHILQGSEQLLWLQQMEREHDNLRQALGWSVEKADRVEIAMSFGTAVHIFWLTRSYLSEARTWLSLILTLDPTPTLVRAKLLRYASDYASTQGDFAQARLLEEEAMDISKQLGDEAGIYSSMDGIAMVAGMQGDYAHAVGLLEQVLAYRRRTGYNVSFIVTLNNLALATRLLGNIERATALYEESISITRKEGIHPSLARALNGLAEIRALQKDYKSAVSLLREAILLRYQLGDLKGMVASLSSISLFTEEQGDMVLSAKLAGAATRLREELGLPIEPVKRSENEALLHRLRIKLGDKIFESAWQAGQSLDQKQLIDLIENTLSYNVK